MTDQPRLRLPPAHAHLQRNFAIPSPLHSPRASRIQTSGDDSEAQRSGPSSDSDAGPAHLPWRARLRHFTWSWFTMTMATGQVANVLYEVPYRFDGLYALGVIVVIFNLVLFVFNVVMISARFKLYPGTFWASLTHPTESLFAPAAVISFGTILLNITQYGVDEHGVGVWLEKTLLVLFWIYCGLAFTSACGIYLIMWSTQTFTISRMTPVWIFPAYPLLVVAPHAAILASKVNSHARALEILVGGFTLQGIGFMVSTMVYAAFIYRLMTQKLPEENLRPGMFISVGPSGFTVSGVIGMGKEIPRVISTTFMSTGALAGTITMIVANWFGIWLWGLALFFFVVSFGANLECLGSKRMHFAMTWFSYVFPNTGLTTATFAVANALDDNKPFRIIGCVFAVLVVLMWLFVMSMMVRGVLLKQVLWPQKQEDRDEGEFVLKRDGMTGSYIMPSDSSSGGTRDALVPGSPTLGGNASAVDRSPTRT